MYENELVEFKRELTNDLEKEVVALLNAKGGHIFIGIEDDENIVGVENPNIVQLNIKDRIMDRIAPSPIGFFDITVEEINDKKVICISVASGNEKPYYIKKYGMSPEGVYIRVGSSSLKLDSKQILSMFSKRARTSLANIISPIQKLTFVQLKIYYEGNGYELNDNFYSMLNLTLDGGEYNYLAYLLSDQNSIEINVGKFKGEDTYYLEQMRTFTDQSIIKTTNEILDYIESFNITFTEIKYPTRVEKKLFDSVAVREAIINAMVHSDYSYGNAPSFRIFDDHLEIISVGGLPEGIEKEEFLSGYTSPKNPPLMKVFRDLKLVEHMGTGIARILKKYDKSIYTFTTNFIKVSIPYDEVYTDRIILKTEANDLTERQDNIKRLVKSHKSITQEEIANILKVSRYTIIREMKELENKKVIRRDGSNKTGSWVVMN